MANINDEDFEESDEDDEDFVPNEDLEDDSDEDILDVVPEDDDDQPNPSLANGNGKKNNSKQKKNLNKKKLTRGSFLHANESENEVDNAEIEENSIPVDEKEKSDSLWANFLSDATPSKIKASPKSSEIGKQISQTSSKASEKSSLITKTSKVESPSKVKVTELFEFAGETVIVTKEVDSTSKEAIEAKLDISKPSNSSPLAGIKRSSGIGSVLGQLSGKKNKLSTLEKSKLDWNRFKEEEGIDEDLKIHNKGKEGYLEKLDFFERTDLRQFEVEKSLRLGNRKK